MLVGQTEYGRRETKVIKLTAKTVEVLYSTSF